MNKALSIDSFEKKISISKQINIAFQHILTMVPGSITVPLILGNALNLDSKTITLLISANLFTSGIATLLQVLPIGFNIGAKLPLVLGSSFAPLGAMIMIGTDKGLPTLFGSIIGSGILLILITSFFERILKLFSPVVVGSFVTFIGIYLAPIALKNIGGGYTSDYGNIKNIMVGASVFLITIIVGKYGTKTLQSMSLLIGILFGTLLTVPLGMINITPLVEAQWFRLIKPFIFGTPKFEISSIIIMTIFCIINFVQCVGAYSVLGEICETEVKTDSKINGLRAVSISQIISGIFTSFPSTMFNENVGLLKITNEKSNVIIRTTGFMLVLFSLSPKFAALITVIPLPVIGGVTLALFGIITSAGVSILSNVNLGEESNFTIVGASLAVGIGVTSNPDLFKEFPQTLNMLLSNGLFMVCAVAIGMRLILNFKKNKKEK